MKCLVTGGGGFLGSHLVRLLIEEGHSVRSLGRSPRPELESLGVEVVQGDGRKGETVDAACDGMDIVFHTAAVAGVWGPAQHYESINVSATLNVVQGCRRAGVPHLVHTSSPSVIFDGETHHMADEGLPYPQGWLCHYPRTKAIAERLVLSSNDTKLSTLALRPHLIWGPGDPHLVPRLIERAKKGRLRQVGNGRNLVDMVHVRNAARAHLDAAKALAQGKGHGKAYFITNGEPVLIWDWVEQLLRALDIPWERNEVSATTAERVGHAMECVWKVLPLPGEPPMTRFVARQLSRGHTYSIEAARRDLGYQPTVTMEHGTRELIDHLRASSF